jgi:hypothetical protein
MPHSLRYCRRHYFNNTDGLIFVVDSADRDRIGKSAQEFQAIIQDPLMLHRCEFCPYTGLARSVTAYA